MIDNFTFPSVCLSEGDAKFLAPLITKIGSQTIDQARSKAPVFFNPIMKLNRDSAILVLSTYQHLNSSSIFACEPMCGTGIRGIRIALEVKGIERVILGDLNPLAVKLSETNVKRNNVSDKIKVRLLSANILLSLHDRPLCRFDYIDIDPYGSPAPYFDSAIRSCRKNGVIALTATDMAPLCGVNPKACIRKYNGRPLRTEYSHESALRLLIGSLASTAAKNKVAIKPLFSYFSDHYVRVYVNIERGAKKTDRCLEKLGFIFHCNKCSNRKFNSLKENHYQTECNTCGIPMKTSGPLWIGDFADDFFCEKMIDVSKNLAVGSNRKLMNLIKIVKSEISYHPWFFNVDDICSKLKIASIPMNKTLLWLNEAGFKSTRTHFDQRGVKTEASINEIKDIIKRKNQ